MEKEQELLKNLPGPESIQRFRLPNGMTVLAFDNASAQSVNITGLLENGARLDAPEKLGTCNFTSAMLSRGTRTRSFAEYHELLESRGANLSFSSGSHSTSLHGKALAEDSGVLLELISESLMQPAFAPDYVERLRQQLLASLAIREQETYEIASLLFDQALFAGHAYGNPVDGFSGTVQAITRQDLADFHLKYYRPEGSIMTISGALAGIDLQALMERYFSGWESGAQKPPAAAAIPGAPQTILRRHRFIEDKSQTDLMMGAFGPARSAEDYLPAYLGNNILGQFGLMGRIGESVRSKSGLAYHASSSLNAWKDGGTWEISAGLNPENLDKAIRLIRDEIERFISEPVSAEELDDSQSNLIGRLPLSLESNAGIANALLTMEHFNLGLDYFQQYAQKIRAVTPAEILEAAQHWLHPDKLVIASAGPGEDLP